MKQNRLISLLILLALLPALCGCGSKAAISYDEAAAYELPAQAKAEYSNSASFAADYDSYEIAEEEAIPEPAAAAGGLSSAGEAGASAVQDTAINQEKLIYTANATLETVTFDETLVKLNELITSFGGFVESSSINGANYYDAARGYNSNRSASYTFRIPCQRFSELMSTLSTLGNVPYTNIYTDNITTQYYDVQARLNAYKAQETRLIEMMTIAETVEDIIKIEERLTEVRYEIDSLQSRLTNWDRSVSYSTLYLTVEEVSRYTPVETIKLTYGEKLVAAIQDGLSSVGEFLADALLWLLEALPTLVVVGLIIWGIAAFLLKLIRTRDARRARRLARADARRQKSQEKKSGTTQVNQSAEAAEKAEEN